MMRMASQSGSTSHISNVCLHVHHTYLSQTFHLHHATTTNNSLWTILPITQTRIVHHTCKMTKPGKSQQEKIGTVFHMLYVNLIGVGVECIVILYISPDLHTQNVNSKWAQTSRSAAVIIDISTTISSSGAATITIFSIVKQHCWQYRHLLNNQAETPSP